MMMRRVAPLDYPTFCEVCVVVVVTAPAVMMGVVVLLLPVPRFDKEYEE